MSIAWVILPKIVSPRGVRDGTGIGVPPGSTLSIRGDSYFAAPSPFFRNGTPSVNHFGAGAPLR